jgi:transposase InsO family protein
MPDDATGGIRIIYLIAFLDDAVRFIVHHRLVLGKRSDTCAAVLAETFPMWDSPCLLGSDNGGEFTGDAFTSLLGEYGVTPWTTALHTPEQNAKIERLWETIECSRSGNCSPQLIADIVHEYNTK